MPRGKKQKRPEPFGPRTKRGELSPFGARYIGQKGKSAQFANAPRCDYLIGGKLRVIRRKRKDKTTYFLPIVIGGRRCQSEVVVKTEKKARCLAHIASDYEDNETTTTDE